VDHSFEEIRSVALDLLAGRERGSYDLTQYQHFLIAVSQVFERREGGPRTQQHFSTASVSLSSHDQDLFLEVFWGLFREGTITLGLNDANRQFPFFRVTEFGLRLIAHQHPYFFHDVSSYEAAIRSAAPTIDGATLVYLKEAMQAFRSGCILSATVMLGVATEHTFLLLLEKIELNPTHAQTYKPVSRERGILNKANKFKQILDRHVSALTPEIREDLDTHFASILSVIRTFRNQAGHPTGTIIDREQAYILLQLFIPYCKKMYQLMTHYA
jgi:hypothetical protein